MPAGRWAKGFEGETVKGSRCWSTLKAGPQSMLGTAQAVLVLVSGQRREKRGSGWAGKGRGGMSHLQTPTNSGTRSGEQGRGVGSGSAGSGDHGMLRAVCSLPVLMGSENLPKVARPGCCPPAVVRAGSKGYRAMACPGDAE